MHSGRVSSMQWGEGQVQQHQSARTSGHHSPLVPPDQDASLLSPSDLNGGAALCRGPSLGGDLVNMTGMWSA